MTRNQIDYQNLLLTKQRDAVNAAIGYGNLNESIRHNKVAESETQRHNKVVEQQAFDQLVINRDQVNVNRYNAETNRMNYYVNQQNADTNARNAETNRLNYYVNVENSKSQRIAANASAMSAQANMLNAQASMAMIPIAEYNATTGRLQARAASMQANAANVRAKNDTSRVWVEKERARYQNDYDAARTFYANQQGAFYSQEALARIDNLNANTSYQEAQYGYISGKGTREWFDSAVNGIANAAKVSAQYAGGN